MIIVNIRHELLAAYKQQALQQQQLEDLQVQVQQHHLEDCMYGQ